MRADRLVGIADRDPELDGEIEHLAASVRRRPMRVAPHVKLLRRAADIDRDRLEREARFARHLAVSVFFVWAALTESFAAAAASSFGFASALAESSLRPASAALAAAFCFSSSARALLGPFFSGERLVRERELGVGAGLERLQFAQRRRQLTRLTRRFRGGFLGSSAFLAASAASRASVSALAGGPRWLRLRHEQRRMENSTGSALSGEMITRIPIRVLSNSLPQSEGHPHAAVRVRISGQRTAVQRDAVQVMRCKCGIWASQSYIFERWSSFLSTTANTPAWRLASLDGRSTPARAESAVGVVESDLLGLGSTRSP